MSVVWCSVLQYSGVYCIVVQCSAVGCSVVQCSVVPCSVVPCSVVPCSVVQCSVQWCGACSCSGQDRRDSSLKVAHWSPVVRPPQSSGPGISFWSHKLDEERAFTIAIAIP